MSIAFVVFQTISWTSKFVNLWWVTAHARGYIFVFFKLQLKGIATGDNLEIPWMIGAVGTLLSRPSLIYQPIAIIQ